MKRGLSKFYIVSWFIYNDFSCRTARKDRGNNYFTHIASAAMLSTRVSLTSEGMGFPRWRDRLLCTRSQSGGRLGVT